MVEQLAVNETVPGSSPGPGAENKSTPNAGCFCFLLSVTAATYVAASGREVRSDVSPVGDTARTGAVRRSGATAMLRPTVSPGPGA